MADIRLVKPQANTAQTVSCAADSRFVLEFPSDAALFARDGDDLVLTFEDGSSIRLQDFYTTYSKEEMPSFEMEGAEISGEDFFAALGNPDLMPAAGPTVAAAQGNSSFNVYGDAALLGGIDRLDGLDISFNWGQQTQDDLYASIGRNDEEGVDYGVIVTPSVPTIGGSTEGGTSTVTTDEGNLVGGSQTEVTGVTDSHGATTSGSLTVNLDHTEGTITIGSLSIAVDKDGNVLSITKDGETFNDLAGVSVSGDHGNLSKFRVELQPDGSIKISYDYTLTSPVDGTGQEDNVSKPGLDGRGESLQAAEVEVMVEKAAGETTGSIVANALDDVPVLKDSIKIDTSETVYDDTSVLQFSIVEGDNVTILENLNFGADVDKATGLENGARLEVTVSHGDEKYTFIASVSRDDDGNLHYEYNENGSIVFKSTDEGAGVLIYNKDTGIFSYTRPNSHVGDGKNDTYSFGVTLVDADGDRDTLQSEDIVTSLAPVEVTGQSIDNTLVTDESYIDGGTGDIYDTEEGAINAIASDSFTVDLHGAAEGATITVSTDAPAASKISGTLHLDENGKWMLNWEESNQSISAEYGSLNVSAVSRNEDGTYTISYFYTQNKAYTDHINIEDPDERTLDSVDKFTVTVSSTDNNTISGTIGVQIKDDGPVLTMEKNVSNEGSIVSDVDISGSFELAYGADKAAETNALTVQIDNGTSVTIDFGDNDTATVKTTLGLLTVSKQENGSYTYKFSGKAEVDSGQHTITFTATDADRDTSFDKVTVNVDKDPSFGLSTSELVTDDSYLDNGTKEIHESSEGPTNTASGTLTLDMADMNGASVTFKVTVEGTECTLTVTLDDTGDIANWTLDGEEQSTDSPMLTTQYGTLTIAKGAQDGALIYTYTQKQAYTSHKTSGSTLKAYDEQALAETITVTVTDKYENSTEGQKINVRIEDDGPVLKVEMDQEPEVSEVTNLVGNGPYEFVAFDGDGNASYRDNAQAGDEFGDNNLASTWGDNVTISAGKVVYTWEGDPVIPDVTIDDVDSYKLQYSNYAGYEAWNGSQWETTKKDSVDWGIMVASPGESADHNTNPTWSAAKNFETEATLDGEHPVSSEAIIIDLGGQLAYGINVNFGAFYSAYEQQGIEQVLITFYKTVNGESQIVGSRIVQGNDSGSGIGSSVTHDEQFLSAGFDKVVISALGNVTAEGKPTGANGEAQGSSFTIQSIDFVTAPNPINVVTGSVTAISGADGFHEDYQEQHVRFDMKTMFGQPSNGEYTLQVLVNGKEEKACITLLEDSSGNFRLTGSVDDKQLFTAYLEKNTGDESFSWKMEQYVGFQIKNEESWSNSFNLSFITKDGDGDWSSESQDILLTPEIVEDTALVVDEAHLVEDFKETDGLYTDTATFTIDDLFGTGSNFKLISAKSKQLKGDIEIYNKNELKYSLKENIDHNKDYENLPNDEYNRKEYDTIEGDTIILTVQDEQNNKYVFEIPVQIIDDVPELDVSTLSSDVITETGKISGLSFVGDNREDIRNGIIERDGIKVEGIRLEYDFDENNNVIEIERIETDNELSLRYADNYDKKVSYCKIAKIDIDKNDIIQINEHDIEINKINEINISNNVYKIMVDDSGNIYIYTSANQAINFKNLNIKINDQHSNIEILPENEIEQALVDSLSGVSLDNGFATDGAGEIGAGTLHKYPEQGDGIKITLDEAAYGLSVKLGAFYSGGPSDQYDHYPERALLSFHTQDDKWIFQEVIPSADGTITFTNDALISQGFKEVYISAVDNVTYGKNENITLKPAEQERSDFVIQSVDFITPILISSGTLTSNPGADGYEKGYESAKFNIDEMPDTVQVENKIYKITYEEAANGTLSAKLSGNGDFDGEFLFKAEIKDDDWIVMIFKEFRVNHDEIFKLSFITKDGDGDSATTTAEIPSTIEKTNEQYQDSSSSVDIENFASSTHEYFISNTIHDNVILSDEIYNESKQSNQTEIQKMDSKEEIHETSDSIADTFMELNKEETSENNAFEEFLTQIEHWESLQPGNDLLFGTAGDDYLNGGEGSDAIFGGSGNDIIVYDENDFMVSGGEGIDFMITDKDLTMDDLLASGRNGNTGPIVDGIDVLIKGDEALSLTNMEQLATEYAITVEGNRIELGEGWSRSTDSNTYIFSGNEGQSLTMEVATNIDVDLNAMAAKQQIEQG